MNFEGGGGGGGGGDRGWDCRVNPLMTNGFTHHYHLGESIFIFRGFRSDFKILFHFSMNFLWANRIAPGGTPRSAASHLGLFCLVMSHKKDARFK